MRKILSLVLIASFVCVAAFAGPTRPGAGFIPPNGGYPFDPPKTFRLVRFDHDTQQSDLDVMTAGSVVVWNTDHADGVTVMDSVITADSRVAGLLATDVYGQLSADDGNTAVEDYGKRNWVYLQTYGYNEDVIAYDEAATTGDAAIVSATAGRLARHGGSTLGTDAANQGILGVWMCDPNGAGEENCKVFIKCE